MLETSVISFPRSVSADPIFRQPSAAATKALSDHEVESSMPDDVFQLVDAVYSSQKDDTLLSSESRYCLAKIHKTYKQMGFGLRPDVRSRFKEIKKRQVSST